MDATHLDCRHCGCLRPIRFQPLLAGEPSLGRSVGCAHCGRHTLVLLEPTRFYCEICDDVRPGLLERVESRRPGALAVLLVCAGCFDAKALLCGSASPPRPAGAAASDPFPPGLPADRARPG